MPACTGMTKEIRHPGESRGPGFDGVSCQDAFSIWIPDLSQAGRNSFLLPGMPFQLSRNDVGNDLMP
ncbi:MAG: hypothetical protein KIS79_01025 [Burkholderiales bacterium]|nr:hypothetical protein [Burkholderiales bacterium]